MNNWWIFCAILKLDWQLINLLRKIIWSNTYDFPCQYSNYCFIKFAESYKRLLSHESEAFTAWSQRSSSGNNKRNKDVLCFLKVRADSTFSFDFEEYTAVCLSGCKVLVCKYLLVNIEMSEFPDLKYISHLL